MNGCVLDPTFDPRQGHGYAQQVIVAKTAEAARHHCIGD